MVPTTTGKEGGINMVISVSFSQVLYRNPTRRVLMSTLDRWENRLGKQKMSHLVSPPRNQQSWSWDLRLPDPQIHLRFCCCFLLKIFFLIWTTFKVFIEFVTILLLFYVLVFWPRGMWDPTSPTRDQTCTPCIGR